MTGRFIRKYLFYLIFIFCPLVLIGQGMDYFWIGGTGNWSDTLHWSSENGGLPTQSDNVIFDANSFLSKNQIVTIDVEAECFKMDWSNVTKEPVFDGTNDLHVFSSFILSQEMEVKYIGNIYFDGNGSDQNVLCAGNSLNSNVYFDGPGIWSISDTLDLGMKNIYMNNGSLNTFGNLISCGSFYSTTANSKAIKLDSTKVIIQGLNGKWQVNNNLYFIKGTSVIEFVQSEFMSTNIFDGGNLSYYDVVFRNNGKILGSNTYEKLYFNANCDYELQGGKTQTINAGLYARGCSGLINISAGQGGVATIAHNNGDINISFVSLRSIEAESNSGYGFYAWHSIDNGDNSGCNISSNSRDMFWINSTGYWSDTTHWISSPADENADCVPILYDDVTFNNASFDGNDTVIADIENIQCNNMKWIGSQSPVFGNSSSNSTLTVHGSLEFSEYMENQYNGKVVFRDSLGGKTIKTSNKIFNNDLFFEGNNGAWSIIDSLMVEGSIYFNRGNLNTNSHFIRCNSFHSDSAFDRNINLGNSYLKLTKNSPSYAWSLNNENLQFEAGNSNIELEYINSSFYNYGGDTISFYNILFSKEIGLARLYTYCDIYAKFHKVDFRSNGLIYSSNSFDTLSFYPGNNYDLPNGHTQTINNEIFPTGNCNGPIVIESSKNGTQAFINKLADTLNVMNTAIRDIAVSGGATFIAQNSVDLGNNTGWDTIQVSTAGKLYWVDGSGDWSDQAHWSTTSGGTGGECIPTPYDTVIFNQNSFSDIGQYVNIDLNNALVHNMDWSTAGFMPEFSGNYSGTNLRIFGSLTLNPEMSFTFPGQIFFEANNPGQTITTNNLKLHNSNNNITFDGIGGEWMLMDSLLLGHALSCKNVVNFNNGVLNTNGQFIKCFNFNSRYNNPRILELDTSTICVCNEWYMQGDNLTLLENNSIIQIDSGQFSHLYGNKIFYNDIQLNSGTNHQKVTISNVDSIFFNDIHYLNKGEISGQNSTVYAEKIQFQNNGFVNTSNLGNENIFVIDTLIFNSMGNIFGNDTVNNYLQFDSMGYITGSGSYPYAIFNNNGNIIGNNQFDTLTFSPGHFYELGASDTLAINYKFNLTGNNCEDIILTSTSDVNAGIHKEMGSVYGEFIQMSNITATGNAIFDAGYFSENINDSNEGWTFHDSPLNYSLGNDTSILEGETINLCAANFNGNSGTTYEWKDCSTGNVVGTDSCYLVTEQGDYCLTVYYNEGPGCVKNDEIYIGCYLKLDIDSSLVSCNGFNDGWIEMTVEVGTAPIEYNWYKDGNLYAQTEDIYDLSAGDYVYIFKDTKDCISNNSIIITEPDALGLDYLATDACFGEETGTITLNVIGGTEPYNYTWSNGSIEPQLTGIEPGNYSVSVSDYHSCPAIEETISISELPLLNFELDGINLTCYQDSSGSINVINLTGGTGNYIDFIWTKDNQAYIFGQQNLIKVQAGEYNLKVIDDFGCDATKEIVIKEPEEIILELEGINGNISLGAIDLTVTGGILPYEYLWSTAETTQDIDPLGGGTYTVEVTDGSGCKSTGSIFVDVHYRVYAPTAFSPNGDGINDEFVIVGLGTDLKEFELTVFNRWGNEIFTSRDAEYHWNGSLNNSGESLSIDVYTWMVKITYSTGETIVDKGNVTLLK